MKNILKITAAIIIVTGFTAATAQVQASGGATVQATMQTNPANEYVYIKNNQVILHQADKDAALTATYTCTDGSTVNSDGLLTRKDGTKIQLGNGDKVISDGRFKLYIK